VEFELSTLIKASPHAVWSALTDPAKLERWWDEGVILEPAAGGHFQEPWQRGEGVFVFTAGKVTEVVPSETISFTWADEEWGFETQVVFALTREEGSTRFSVRHLGWENAPTQERTQLMESHRGGWTSLLASLKDFVEGQA